MGPFAKLMLSGCLNALGWLLLLTAVLLALVVIKSLFIPDPLGHSGNFAVLAAAFGGAGMAARVIARKVAQMTG